MKENLDLGLKDKVAIVAGGGSYGDGIGNGRAASILLAEAGAKVLVVDVNKKFAQNTVCLLYTSPSPRDATLSRMPSSA